MVSTSAERSRRYRERMKLDQNKYEVYKKKKHESYLKNRKPINEQGARDQRKTRRSWRINKRNSRLQKSENNQQTALVPVQEIVAKTPKRSTAANGKRFRRKLNKSQDKIAELTVKLKTAQRIAQRLKVKLRTSGERDTPRKKANMQLNQSPRKLRRTLVFHNTVIAEIRDRVGSCKGTRGKQILSRIICGRIMKKYRLLHKARTAIGLHGTMKDDAAENTIEYQPKKYARFVLGNMATVVADYFHEDINTKLTPGKKETITRHKVKKQKRYLNDTVKNIHKKFTKEKNVKISYSAFLKLKPFWVVEDKNRETCACKKCANIGLQISTLHRIGEIPSREETSLIEQTTCEFEYNCMNNTCSTCKGKKITYTMKNADEVPITWYAWVSVKEKRTRMDPSGKEIVYNVQVTIKRKKTGTVGELKQEFDSEFVVYKKHKYNIRQQYTAINKMKQGLGPRECAIVVDFSENYGCKYEKEVQSVHFGASRKQVCLHTGVLYSSTKRQSFCTMSENTRHDPAAIWAHLAPVLRDLNEDYDTVHFISDSPCTQYRCAKNFFLFHMLIHTKYGFGKATWNFTEAGHGKSAADGVGGLIKRTADQLVNFGSDIADAHSLFIALKGKTDVNVFFVTNQDIYSVDLILRDKKIKSVKGTMLIHQILSVPGNTLQHRTHSCFCQPDCDCFNLQTVGLSVSMIDPNSGDINDTVEQASLQEPEGDDARDQINHVATTDAQMTGYQEYDTQVGSFVAVALETSKKNRVLFFAKVVDIDKEAREVEVKFMKAYKQFFVWPTEDDISAEPLKNVLPIAPPKLVDHRRHFYSFPCEVILSVKAALNIVP